MAPEEVVAAAARRGVRVMAITDHHDLSAFRPAREASRGLAVTVLPGVELTCPSGRSGVHVLGVFAPTLDIPAATAALELETAGLGNASGYVPYDVVEAVRRIHRLGGLAIAAHARSSKGLLEECRGQTQRWILEKAKFDAIELAECRDPYREVLLPEALAGTAVICGSDAHELEDHVAAAHPLGVGSRPFWADGPNATFTALRFAFSSAPPGVEPLPRFLDLRGRPRIDQLLRVGAHFLRLISDDAAARRDAIVDAAIELLNGDGGYVLVGVRRRFSGATRGAELQLSLGQLHDLVGDAIYPSPVIRLGRSRGANGAIHELGFMSSENPARSYERRSRDDAARAARADSAALEALGALDIKRMTAELRRRAGDKALGVGELVRLWPYRDWFSADGALTDLVGQGLATSIIEDESTPRWLRLWAAEQPRARHHFRIVYRSLVRRAATREHRERLREALAESVRAGRLRPAQRRSVEQWFERTQAELLAGEPALEPPNGGVEELRERATRVFGDAMATALDTEAQRAEAQYRAAMQEAYGAQAEVVLEVQGGSGDEQLTLGDLEALGIGTVIVSGAGAGTGALLVVPDRLSTLGAPELLELWAKPEVPDVDVIPGVVRRCVECGKHVPVMRFGNALDRGSVETLIAELGDVGAAQQRNAILRDLGQLLESPAAPSASDPRAAVEALDEELEPEALKAAADAACDDPDAAREVLARREELVAAIQRAAQPGTKLTVRRPAIVLAGATGDRDLLEDWTEETNPQARLSLVEGISLLGENDDVDRVLFEALASNAGLVERAARALARRGEPGYESLLAHLPPGASERMYLVNGLVPVSENDPDRARLLAYRSCEDATGPALYAVRLMDRHLYLEAARKRNAE